MCDEASIADAGIKELCRTIVSSQRSEIDQMKAILNRLGDVYKRQPPAVLAFGHGENTAHCLSHADAVNHGMAKAHHAEHQGSHSPSVADGVASVAEHSSPVGDHHQMTCCGLFCVSALAADAGNAIDLGDAHSFFATFASSLFSRSPERLDRPPISLLAV